MYEKYIFLRDKKGVTNYRVAIDTGIPKSTFSEWKAGRSNPKIDKIKKLADYFGVTIDYFLSDSPVETEKTGSQPMGKERATVSI